MQRTSDPDRQPQVESSQPGASLADEVMNPAVKAYIGDGARVNIATFTALITKESVSLRILIVRCVLNVLCMFCYLPKVVYMMVPWEGWDNWERAYWTSWPFFLAILNGLGHTSIW